MIALRVAPKAGIWCRELGGWDAFCASLVQGPPAVAAPEPFPDLLPAREGRRAPLYVRLAVEAGIQACRASGVDPGNVATVFGSAWGDLEVTDYMCRALASPAPVLSPTRFHNSVHNTASGYWSIGAANRHPATAISAGRSTAGAALLEAGLLAAEVDVPVLVVLHDVPALGPLAEVSANRQPFAAALLVTAVDGPGDWRPLTVERRAQPAPPPVPASPWLARLAAENDSASALALLEGLARTSPFTITLPLGAATSLRVAID